MSRIRTIKPEIWHSVDFMELDVVGQLTFIALITLADDHGRLKTSARHLRQVAVRGASEKAIANALNVMDGRGMVRIYVRDGAQYVALCHWSDHQKVDKPRDSNLPEPPKRRERSRIVANSREDSPRTDRSIDLDRSTDPRAREAAPARGAPTPAANGTDLRLAKEQAELEGWLLANQYGSETRHAFMLCQQEGIRAKDVIALAKAEIKAHHPTHPLAYIVKSPELLTRLRKHGAPAPEFAAAVGELVQKFAVDA